MADERKNGVGESTLTVKWWAILIVFLGIFGWFFVTALAHENRITKVETTLDVKIENMTKALDKLTGAFERHSEQGR